MPRPSDPNLPAFEARLDAQLKDWRTADPPAALRSKIAARLAPPEKPRRRLIPVLGAGALTGAVALGILLTYPGSIVRPAPAFAEVQKAMESVESVSFLSTSDVTYPGVHDLLSIRCWLRKNPPALATEETIRTEGKVYIGRTLLLANRKIEQHTRSGEWTVEEKKTDVGNQIKKMLRALTQPGIDDPNQLKPESNPYKQSPWKSHSVSLKGKRFWVYSRTFRLQNQKRIEGTIEYQVWADEKTSRVVRSEVLWLQRDRKTGHATTIKTVSGDFRYNEPAPPGTFELEPPKGK